MELEVERNFKVGSTLVTPRISDSGKVSIGLPISRKVSSFLYTTVSSRFYDLSISHFSFSFIPPHPFLACKVDSVVVEKGKNLVDSIRIGSEETERLVTQTWGAFTRAVGNGFAGSEVSAVFLLR